MHDFVFVLQGLDDVDVLLSWIFIFPHDVVNGTSKVDHGVCCQRTVDVDVGRPLTTMYADYA